jgi:UDP:flavonoid glycosyltransferase YjiC (YdhE family)
MSRILLAWELGTGVGHLAAFRTVAEALLARGHQLTLAARDTGSAAMVFSGLPVQIVQAPLCVKTYNGLADPPLNFSEILMRFGYLDSAMLKGLLLGWRSLLELTQADRLVADHAPTALLAARERGIARITFGNPFSVPPAVSPTPNMRDWLTVPAQRLQGSDATVVAAINAAMTQDAPPIAAVHEIFDGADRLFVGIPALDPYGARPSVHYLGLHSASSGTAAANWPEGDGPRLFAYLRTDYPHMDACLRALSESAARSLVNLAGANPEIISRYGSARLRLSTGHVDMAAAASRCDAALCHGGLGTVNAMLRAGKPLLLLPAQLEQYLLACNVERLGAGLAVHPETAAPDFAGALHSILTDARFGKNAQAVAQRCSTPSVQQVIAHAVARIEAGGPGSGA